MTHYDVVYGITVHEQSLSVEDLTKNIQYYNHTLKTCIVLNGSSDIYDAVKHLETTHVRVICSPRPRRMVTYDILEGYLEVFEYCAANSISADYFIPIASNCMFWKEVTKDTLLGTLGKSTLQSTSIQIRHTGWWWPKIYANANIVSILGSQGIHNLKSSQHEGVVIEFSIMEKISTFIKEHRIKENVQYQTVFEEFLLSTLYTYYTGRDLGSLCRIFWELREYSPSKEHILACSLPCVKRVSREYNSPVRVWLRERAENYSRE